MKRLTRFFILLLLLYPFIENKAQPKSKVRKSDIKKDVLIETDLGKMVFRLNDKTPLHRNNFINLVRSKYYHGISFHRVIKNFMIQAGDENTKVDADTTKFLSQYTIPAEFNSSLFHKKGVLAAARMGDEVNPSKSSSGVQFYIVQGRIFTNPALDSVEIFRLKGKKIPEEQRAVYKTLGGTPHLDMNYTVFGEIMAGYEVIDSIASVKTTGMANGDKPLNDIRIIKTSMIRRRKIDQLNWNADGQKKISKLAKN